jgi:hypothetical protein
VTDLKEAAEAARDEAQAARNEVVEIRNEMSEVLDGQDLQPMTILEIVDIWNRY